MANKNPTARPEGGGSPATWRALPPGAQARPDCGFFACLSKSEKGETINPLVLLSRERRNFDVERKLSTLERNFYLQNLRLHDKLPSHKRRKSPLIFT